MTLARLARPTAARLALASASAALVVFFVSMVSCTEPALCTQVDGCTCDPTQGSCDLACSGAGCEFTCPEGISCSFACDVGGCKATGTSKTSFELDCAGGDCSVVCDELVYTAGPSTEGFVCDAPCDCY